MARYFHGLIRHHLSIFVMPDDEIVEVNPPADGPVFRHPKARTCLAGDLPAAPAGGKPGPDYVLLNGSIHHERNIQEYLGRIRGICGRNTRLLVVYYSSAWRPLLWLATKLGLRSRTPESNWLAPQDVRNILFLSGFETVMDEGRILCPVYIPVLGALLNRWVAPLPFFRMFCVLHIHVARIVPAPLEGFPSVSVIVPARNEEGNIADLIRRLPPMGSADELIFIEGHSTDGTWQAIQNAVARQGKGRRILADRQDGKGKGDAVRKGFAMAGNDILMILDADLTVPPEILPQFYRAIAEGKGEFINGSRLVYPMDDKAMRFFNMLGNKFFAFAFSFVLGQRFKDTLCGTKVLSRSDYQKIARHRGFFGEFDPFGDFDLIFGAARLGLRTVEVPVRYRERTYGTTNIQRWRHGFILLRMVLFAARKFRFV
jgi:GT2 family glycosyltransferase